jgi:very-short-patch-repair endonuclease
MKPKRKIIPYSPHLKPLARKLRNNSTSSEIFLWEHLKGKQMLGFDFHRQKPVDNYILDFFCCELMLGIELDGYTHDFPEVQEKDKIKEKRMNELKITILRFKDEEVYYSIEKVLNVIECWIKKNTPPTPSLEGKV